MKRLLLALSLVAAVGATAADTATTTSPSTSTTTLSNLWNKIKESPVSVSWLNDTYIDSKGADGFTSDNYVYLNYKIDKYHKLTLKPMFRTSHDKTQKGQGDYHTELSNTEFRFTRSKILTEEKHGVNMSFLLRNYFVNDEARKTGYDSYHYLYTSFSKTWGKFTLGSNPYILQYNRNSGDFKRDKLLSIGVVPTYSFTDNFSVTPSFIWYSYKDNVKDAASNTQGSDNILLSASADYSIGALSVSLYFESWIVQSNDGYATGVHQWWNKGAVGTTLYYTLF
ncbi:hypothetical protein [Bacteriovorax sp. Seq25_V]|uniref:hypothetical protein n=1 Tax=Bacteriovorax sp. Seq25_V TaxID=1201288 RepID=UPI00038A30AF|nr:hypothetical protein [Bacteriovorax sp. Seq25_V]EQC44375.1 hypothetical protein M900_A0433 [Bacteriovorax sp. Seq25_V]